MAYNTGNPVGSRDPRDFMDNAQNIDEWANSTTETSQPDRRGVSRKTWHGMEQEHLAAQAARASTFSASQSEREQAFQAFLSASGYVDMGDYGPGIELTARHQLLLKDGAYWRLHESVPLPYTTTGTWAGESGNFVSTERDAPLRQELAAPGGAGLVGFQQSGAGAVARTIEDKARERVSPKDFGAIGDGVADDTTAVSMYADWCEQNQQKLIINGNYLLASEVTITTCYGMDMSEGSIVIGGDFNPFRIKYVVRGAKFSNLKFKPLTGATIGRSCLLIEVNAHAFGIYFDGFSLIAEGVAANNTWTGVRFTSDTPVSYGLFGGTSFDNFQTMKIHSSIKIDQNIGFVNGLSFSNSFSSYDLQFLLTEKVVSKSNFKNIHGQENVDITLNCNSSGGFSECSFVGIHNWDTNVKSINLTTSSSKNVIKGVYPREVRDYGYITRYVDQLVGINLFSASRVWADFIEVQSTVRDFERIFNTKTIVGSAGIFEGCSSIGDGYRSPVVIFSVPALSDSASMDFIASTITSPPGGRGLYDRYSTVKFECGFSLNSISLQDYSFAVGIFGHGGTSGAKYSRYLILTNFGGNFVFAEAVGFSSEIPTSFTVVKTLKPLDTRYHELGIISGPRESSGVSKLHFDTKFEYDIQVYTTDNKSPFIHAINNGSPFQLELKRVAITNYVTQGW